MASTVSDDSGSARRLRLAQRGLSRLLLRDVRALRRLIVPSRPSSIPPWIEAMNTIVTQYGQTAASIAADFYDAEREAARVAGTFTVPIPDPPPQEQVESSLRWATKDLWPRDPERATEAQLQPIEIRLEQAEKKIEAVAQKLVVGQSRDAIQGAVRRDRVAVGWARSAALGACSFCKLLASRGMVYAQDTVKFRAHDGCNCGAVPVFKGQRFELSPHASEWERLYREYAAPHSGDQLRRFRLALAEHDSNPLPGSN